MRIGEQCLLKDLVVGDRGRYISSKQELIVVCKVDGWIICHYPNDVWQFAKDPGDSSVEYLGKGKLEVKVVPVITLEEAAKSLNKHLRSIYSMWYAVGITNNSLVVYYNKGRFDQIPKEFDSWETFPVKWVKTEIPELN